MRHNSNRRLVEQFLEQHGASEYVFVRQSRHDAVVVAWRGRNITVTVPRPDGNWRQQHHVIWSLRHALGLVGKVVS